jgi:hypothetical protein
VVSVAVPLFHVTAVVGDAVYLPCDITTGAGDAVLLVLWYREDLGTPIYRSVTPPSVCFLLSFNVPWVKGKFIIHCYVYIIF